MKKTYAAQLAKPKKYRFTLHAITGKRLAELEVTVQKFLLVLRSYNTGQLHAFTLFALRSLGLPTRTPHLYYVEIHPEVETWIPHRSGDDMGREGLPVGM